jgi:hypothetical protein
VLVAKSVAPHPSRRWVSWLGTGDTGTGWGARLPADLARRTCPAPIARPVVKSQAVPGAGRRICRGDVSHRPRASWLAESEEGGNEFSRRAENGNVEPQARHQAT